jgi:hypothetical protein
MSETPSVEKRQSQADILIELVTAEKAVLFRDQFNEPYAYILVDGHWEIWKIRSKQFRRWLCSLMWEAEQKAPNANAITSALTIIESRACFKGEQITLENRVCWHEGALWYDLSNAQWEAVRITQDGWEIVTEPPILFRRFAHQSPQVTPNPDGSIEALKDFLNLANPEQELLLFVYLVTCFLPDIPHPIPVLYGPQGASKTTLARILRRFIDPSAVEVLSLPMNINDLVQQLSHHWFAFFDNVTGMPGWVSDALCRAVTGEGFSKRELYSDDDDVIYAFRRCLGLNGINLAVQKPDLLDRSILFKLERIAREHRKGEKDLWERFERARPQILGGIFDVLSQTMRLRRNVELQSLPRMADFAFWGCAAAQALGHTQEEFLDAYYQNIGEQNEEAIHENPVAIALMAWMENRDEWEGTPSELLNELEAMANVEKIDMRQKYWPKAANALSRRINEVKTNLAEVGVVIRSEKATNGKRMILIQKVPISTDTTATPSEQSIGGQMRLGDDGALVEEPPEVSPSDKMASVSAISDSGDSGDVNYDPSLPF